MNKINTRSFSHKFFTLAIILFLSITIISLIFIFTENKNKINNTHKQSNITQKKTKEKKVKNIFSNKTTNKTTNLIPSSRMEELKKRLLTNISYNFKTWEIVQHSLREYDMNNDKQLDIVGFLRKKDKYGTSWRFTTWFKEKEKYRFYNDGYQSLYFTTNKEEEKEREIDTPCEIIDLAINKITLNCQKGGGSPTTILYYQPNGEGYYTNPNDQLYNFIKKPNLKTFDSKIAGIEFQYPKNLTITENTYKLKNEKFNLIEIKNNNKIILTIYSHPGKINESGAVIDSSGDNIFLKNLDGIFFTREKYFKDNDNFDYIYHQAIINKRNNEGSIFNSRKENFTIFGKEYIFYASTDKKQINEIDNIIASTKFFQSINNNNYKTVSTTPNKKFEMKNVLWKLPGIVTTHIPENKNFIKNNDKAIMLKDFDVKLINSSFFYPAHIIVKLLPYKSIKFLNLYADTGFDAEKNKCYHVKYTNKNKQQKIYEKPQTINGNQVCISGTGDAGFFIETYYIMDPNKKHILSISQTNSGQDTLIVNTLFLDLLTLAKTVKFSN